MRWKTTVLIMIALSVLAFPRGASGQNILLYAYDFTDSLEIALEPIGINLMGWLIGLDYPEEWVEYDLEPQSYGTYKISMAVRGAENVPYHLEMKVIDESTGEEQVVPFDFIGMGFGSCTCNIISVSGEELGLYKPSYKVRLTTSTAGELWVYSFTLPVLTATDSHTWGGIKGLFRD